MAATTAIARLIASFGALLSTCFVRTGARRFSIPRLVRSRLSKRRASRKTLARMNSAQLPGNARSLGFPASFRASHRGVLHQRPHESTAEKRPVPSTRMTSSHL